MSKKLLIDLVKCRNCKECNTKCSYMYHPSNNGIKLLREYASFSLTCRQCEDAPCISVCPASALEKNRDGMIMRNPHLCRACKSCVTICPFGSLMNDFFDTTRSVCDYCSFTDATTTLACIDSCSENAISFVDMEENKRENIFALNDKVLARDYNWHSLKNEN